MSHHDDDPSVEFEQLEHTLLRSSAARVCAAVLRVGSAAMRSSVAAAAIIRLAGGLRALPLPVQVRLAGVSMLAFVAVHVGLLQLIPANVAPAMPLVVWLLVGLAAALLVALPEALARAWNTRGRRRR